MESLSNFLAALFSIFSGKEEYLFGWRGPEPRDAIVARSIDDRQLPGSLRSGEINP